MVEVFDLGTMAERGPQHRADSLRSRNFLRYGIQSDPLMPGHGIASEIRMAALQYALMRRSSGAAPEW